MGGPSSGSTGGGGGGNENVGPAGAKYVRGKKFYGTKEDAKKASKRHEFRQSGAKKIDKIKTPSPVLNILKEPFKAGSRITRDFFTDKVLTSKRGYKGMNKASFENLSIAEQDEIYAGYISDRHSGDTDAYGNKTYKGGKSEEQPKVASQMDNTGVKSDMITADKTSPTTVEMAQLSEDERLKRIKRKGRRTTVLTQDTDEKPTLSKKVLLG